MRKLAAVLFILLYAQSARAAVTYDTFAEGSGLSSGGSFNITISASLSNVAVMVLCHATYNVDVVMTSVTVGGSATTSLANMVAAAPLHSKAVGGFVVALGSASGSKSVVANYTGTAAFGVDCVAVSASGVNQTTPGYNGNSSATAGFGDAPSVTLTGGTASDLAINMVQSDSSAPSGNNQTSIYASGGDSSGAQRAVGAASVVFSWAGNGWCSMNGAYFQASGGATCTPSLTLINVGAC